MLPRTQKTKLVVTDVPITEPTRPTGDRRATAQGFHTVSYGDAAQALGAEMSALFTSTSESVLPPDGASTASPDAAEAKAATPRFRKC